MARTTIRTEDVTAGAISATDIASNSITATQIAADAVTSSELADDAVTIAKLAATGTASATTFLRGDNAWASAAAGFEALRIYTSSTTWSKSTNSPTKILVECIAGGGGSGAGPDSGGSGGAGAYAMAFLDVATVDPATVTVGAGGAAGSSDAGGVGGDSKFTYATGTGSFTEIDCPGGNGGGNANHVAGATTALPTGPTNGVYIAGSGGGGASSAGQVAHGYGAVSSTTATTTSSVGYGGGEVATSPAGSGAAGRQGLVLVWEYK